MRHLATEEVGLGELGLRLLGLHPLRESLGLGLLLAVVLVPVLGLLLFLVAVLLLLFLARRLGERGVPELGDLAVVERVEVDAVLGRHLREELGLRDLLGVSGLLRLGRAVRLREELVHPTHEWTPSSRVGAFHVFLEGSPLSTPAEACLEQPTSSKNAFLR